MLSQVTWYRGPTLSHDAAQAWDAVLLGPAMPSAWPSRDPPSWALSRTRVIQPPQGAPAPPTVSQWLQQC